MRQLEVVDDYEAWLARPIEPLALPLGVIGVLGACYARDSLRFLGRVSSRCFHGGSVHLGQISAEDTAFLALLTGAAFFVAGRLLSRRIKDGRPVRLFALAGTLVAPLAAGMLHGLFSRTERSLAFGLTIALFALPWTLLASWLAEQAWRSRRATPAHRLFRRMTWLAVAGQTTTSAIHEVREQTSFLFGGHFEWSRVHIDFDHMGEEDVAATLFAVAVAAALLFVVLCARDYLRLAWLRHRLQHLSPRATPETHDLGLGDDSERWMTRPESAYRDQARLLAEVRGDFGRVERALALLAALSAALVVVAATSLAVQRVC